MSFCICFYMNTGFVNFHFIQVQCGGGGSKGGMKNDIEPLILSVKHRGGLGILRIEGHLWRRLRGSS